MRGSGDWDDPGITDEGWRATIFELEPNGDIPLTGITAMSKNEVTDNKHINWITDKVVIPQGDNDGLFEGPGLTNAYASGTLSVGDTLIIQCDAETAGYFAGGERLWLIENGTYAVRSQCKVTADPVVNGASSYITTKILKADTYGTASSVSNSDWLISAGDISEEGALVPKAVSYEPVPVKNVTGIKRTSVNITRSEYVQKHLRTNPQAYEYIKGKAGKIHSIMLEEMLLWSEYDATTLGDGGKPEFSPMGLFEFTETYSPGNIFNYLTDVEYTADPWLTSGDLFLKKALETIMAFGSTQKLAVVGPAVIRAITDLAETNGQYIIDWRTEDYGLKIATFHSPYGSLDLKVHPLFRYNETDNHRMLIFEPQNIVTRPFEGADMIYLEDERKHKKFARGYDSVNEEFLTEITWEFHNPEAFGEIRGVGLLNPLT